MKDEGFLEDTHSFSSSYAGIDKFEKPIDLVLQAAKAASRRPRDELHAQGKLSIVEQEVLLRAQRVREAKK